MDQEHGLQIYGYGLVNAPVVLSQTTEDGEIEVRISQKPKDLDFATTATPDQMKEMFSAEEIRMINMNGEKHGTVTPRINDSVNFEVTTLRIDVRTDGRHAEVEFTTDWKLDANRRDLTINSMFYGRIAQDPDKHEEKTLQSIQDNADGLKRISGERIWTELQQILEGNFACELVKTMLSLDLGPPIGLPENPNLVEFDKVWQRVKHLKYHSMTLLSALFRNQEEVMTFHSRVKLSAYDRDLGLFIVANRDDKPSIKPLRPYQMLVLTSKVKVSDTRKWVEEVFKYRGNTELLQQFMEWEIPKFPVSGHTLKENGVPAPNQFETSPECNRDDSFGKCRTFSASSTHPRQYHKVSFPPLPSPNFIKPMLLPVE
uniref:Poly A polymerase head domain-containing protein n=1 Tax=Timema bartmani TaxID=61472 RepID=A0A7R9HYE6_9NEOP|nr:unnamed protein product [Timema bartmani]